MINLRAKLLGLQYVVVFIAYVGAALMHEETALVGLLAVPLIVLKMTGIIAWSWTWVLSPIWGEIVVGVLAILGICAYLHWGQRRGSDPARPARVSDHASHSKAIRQNH